MQHLSETAGLWVKGSGQGWARKRWTDSRENTSSKVAEKMERANMCSMGPALELCTHVLLTHTHGALLRYECSYILRGLCIGAFFTFGKAYILSWAFFSSISYSFPPLPQIFHYLKTSFTSKKKVSARVGGMMITHTKKLLVNLFSYGSGLLGVIKAHIVLLLRCTFGGQSQHLGVLKMELVIWSKPGVWSSHLLERPQGDTAGKQVTSSHSSKPCNNFLTPLKINSKFFSTSCNPKGSYFLSVCFLSVC